MCPHDGPIIASTTNARVKVMKMPGTIMGDTYTVAGCPFFVGPKPQPCVMVPWMVPAMRVKVMGKKVLLKTQLKAKGV